MHTPSQLSLSADASLRAASFAVDIRCAVALAKVALQALADLHPEAASNIDHGLAFEIEAVRQRDDADALAVIAILTDVRARLAGDDAQVTREDSVWYME